MGVWFRRRVKSQSINVERLLDTLNEDRGEISMHGMIITADRGCGFRDLLKVLIGKGNCGFMVMLEHLLRYHTFVGKYHFNYTAADDEVD